MEAVNFILPVPPSANRYWRTTVIKGRAMTFVSKEAQQYKKIVAEITSMPTPLFSEISIAVKFFRAQRSGDLDNRLKCLFDAMQKIVYVNDSQIVEIHAYRFEDKQHPRVEVEITPPGLL